jgi:hypothetical protein
MEVSTDLNAPWRRVRKGEIGCLLDGIQNLVEPIERWYKDVSAGPQRTMVGEASRCERAGQTKNDAADLHETDIFRWPIIVIMFAIHIMYRRGCEFILIDIIKRGNCDKIERAAFRTVFTLPNGANTACATEVIVNVGSRMSRRRPVIFRLRICPRDGTIVFWLHQREPGARFGAN